MEEHPISVYEGGEPFAFISYAHADSDRVLPLIRGLQQQGMRIWYDGGIDAGFHWGKVIAAHLEQSACVICFLSPGYVVSDNCNQELYYAKKKKKGLALGHLEEFQLPPELDMELVLLNHTFRHHFSSDEAFLEELCRSKLLEPCMERGDYREQGKLMPGDEEMGISSVTVEREPEEETEHPGEEFFRRGNQFLEGNGSAKDEAAAVWWYTKAAELGHVHAQCKLGACYASGRGVEQNLMKSLQWYVQAAKQGDAGAQFHVGYCYDKGRGVAPNPTAAAEWYKMAAEQDHVRAQSVLAGCYSAGRGVEQNPELAWQWYRLAADQGDRDAQFNLGFCYDKGRGTEMDPAAAAEWYAKAAEQNDPRAQFNLGQCFAAGRGVPKNPVIAARWFTRAADQDFPAALYALSLCYRNGVGVVRDKQKADRLLKRSKG